MDTLMAAFDGRVQLLDDYVRHRVGFGTEQSAGPSAATITTKVDGSTSLAYRTWLTQWEEMRAAVDRLEYDLAAVRLHLDREQHALASPGMAVS